MARFEKRDAYTFNSDTIKRKIPKEIGSYITDDPKESVETLIREYLQFTDIPHTLFPALISQLEEKQIKQLLPAAFIASVFVQDAFEKRHIQPHLNPIFLPVTPVTRHELMQAPPGDYFLMDELYHIWKTHHPTLFTSVQTIIDQMTTHPLPFPDPHETIVFSKKSDERKTLEKVTAKAYALFTPFAPRMITIPQRRIPISLPA